MLINGVEYKIGKSLPKPLCRWWLRLRPCKKAIHLGPTNTLPCMEFYVPWWAWQFELLHRLIFGSSKISKLD